MANITISGLNNNIYGCSTITSSGSNNIVIASNSTGYSFVDPFQNSKDFIEFVLQLIGIDLTYDKFIEMNEMERKTFIRDYRLEKLLKNNEE